MCGAAASIVRRSTRHGPSIRGKEACQDAQLRKLLREWEKAGEQFTGMMLMAAGKEKHDTYDQEIDRWSRVEYIIGDCGLVLKTTSRGWLSLWVTERGFEWQHVESYRMQKSSSLKFVASCSGRLDIPQFLEHLDAQKNQTYIHAEDWKKTNNDKEIQVYQDFAKSLYTGMSGEACEGETDCDDLNYPKEARGGIGS
mmetsp:Transcript_42544/g.95650  ORF Transcript_42544/g.95650 Transcript_42544/m.95650 type:complete len:197 (+) Transcript_42544:101-691(+)